MHRHGGGHSYKYPACGKPRTLAAILWKSRVHCIFVYMTQVNIFPLLVFTILSSCGQSNSVNPKNNNISTLNNNIDTISKIQFHLDTSIIAILPVDKSNPWLFKDAKAIDLTNEDLGKVDQLLIDCINTHNVKQDSTKQFSEFIDLKKYKRQYVPFIDSKGERKVYVNCFCTLDSGFDYWKKFLVQVDDGGSCFFQLLINLTKLKYEQFSTNGYG